MFFIFQQSTASHDDKFLIKMAFAVTISKVQGQTFKHVSINPQYPAFSPRLTFSEDSTFDNVAVGITEGH